MPIRQTLRRLDIGKSTFYNWLKRYQERYVAQLIKLAFLSADIIRQVFKGNLPQDLTFGKLKANFDIRWGKQRAFFSYQPIIKR